MDNLKRNLPPLSSLVAFEAAARLGSFSDAARELNVTREAVSRQIRALEAHLGLSLFERSANSTILRDWGQRYFQTITANLENIAIASHAIRGEDEPTPPADIAVDTGERILVVDDLPSNLRRLRDVLSSQYDVIACADAGSALDWLAGGGVPDLAMLDIRMAGMDGYTLCRRIKTMPGLDRLPIMFLTSLDTPEDETEGFAAGACDYIARPFAPAVLLARLRVHLDLRGATMALEDLLRRRADRLERAEALLSSLAGQLGDYRR